jgi:hypothetical protein
LDFGASLKGMIINLFINFKVIGYIQSEEHQSVRNMKEKVSYVILLFFSAPYDNNNHHHRCHEEENDCNHIPQKTM